MRTSCIRWLNGNAVYICIPLICVCYCCYIDPISRDDSHYYRMVLAGIVAVLLLLYYVCHKLIPNFSFPFFKRSATHVERFFYTSLIVLCILGIFNYYQFDGKVFLGGGDYSCFAPVANGLPHRS